MSPHYVYHKPNPAEGRRSASFIYHYVCAQKMKYRQGCDHANRVLAKKSEQWIIDQVGRLVDFGGTLDRAVDAAQNRASESMQPEREALAFCRTALQENERQIDGLLESAAGASGALLDLLSEKAHRLKLNRERLRMEQRDLNEKLAPINESFDTSALRSVLSDFNILAENAEPLEIRRMLGLIVRKIEWSPTGDHKVQFYFSNKAKKTNGAPSREDAPLVRDFCMTSLAATLESRTSVCTSHFSELDLSGSAIQRVFELTYRSDGSPDVDSARVLYLTHENGKRKSS